MGAYTAFLDLTLGLASPALGLIGGVAGLGTVFLASTLSVLCAAPIAMHLLSARSIQEQQRLGVALPSGALSRAESTGN